jgi:DNA polymerase-3 subunit beta
LEEADMKLTVERKELQEKLSLIQGVVERKALVPVLSHFKLEAKAGGAMIEATDIETGIRVPLEAQVEAEGTACLPARRLLGIVKELAADVEIEEQWPKVEVRSGEADFKLSCLPVEEFPAWPEVGEEALELSVDAPALREMIGKTLFAAGVADNRYALNGLLFHLHGQAGEKKLTVVGTDGHRLCAITKELPSSTRTRKAIIPRKAAAELRRLLVGDDQVEVSITKNLALFRAGGAVFWGRLIDGTFPAYEDVIPKENGNRLSVDREAFASALRRVAALAVEGKSAVELEFGSSSKFRGVKLGFEQADIGTARERVEADYQGAGFSARFNVGYLLDVLGALGGGNAVMEVENALSPALITGEEDPDYRCVVMPVRR